jgi:hypothetical protein
LNRARRRRKAGRNRKWRAFKANALEGVSAPFIALRVKIELSLIRRDRRMHPRARGLKSSVVADYADAMAAGRVLPPIVVFWDGETYWLADGWHRCAAATGAGVSAIDCNVLKGGEREARLYACGANVENGLRRTVDDERAVVLMLLRDPEWSSRPDRNIARLCKVNPALVNGLRQGSMEPIR